MSDRFARESATVTETAPPRLTLVSMGGIGWNCSGKTCARNDVLIQAATIRQFTVTVNVELSATSPEANVVSFGRWLRVRRHHRLHSYSGASADGDWDRLPLSNDRSVAGSAEGVNAIRACTVEQTAAVVVEVPVASKWLSRKSCQITFVVLVPKSTPTTMVRSRRDGSLATPSLLAVCSARPRRS